MNIFLKLFFIILPIYLIIDFIWLGIIMKDFYNEQFSFLNKDGVVLKNWVLAFIVYILVPIGLIVFVIPKITGPLDSFLYGGLYGLIVYGVYDLTNYVTLSSWSLKLVIVDMAWGFVVCGILSYISFFILKFLN